MQNPLIRCENVSFQYGEERDMLTALKNINLEINRGEFVAILGHNGSGKSTLAKHFNAVLTPTNEGRVLVGGIDTKDEERIFDVRRQVGMVFQNPDNQIVATIVEEDVAFAPENLGVPQAEIRKRVDDALEAVGMSEYKKHAPHKLSGGQKQRVAIAGVLAMQSECIVLDEPTAMLDPKGREQVMAAIVSLAKEQGKTVILITHFMEEAALCDRVIVMNDGAVLLDGAPKEVFSKRAELKSVGLSVPAVTELCAILNENGVEIQSNIISEEECLKEVLKILKG
ncbi:MAG: energy-coupling factor transporter ATPase [Oscillospiraceae bacterium]|nr:energy-coupling factor transporter ATPase [Oscillospiraceae bacterium]